MIHAYKGVTPKIHESAFIEPSAQIVGDVEIGEESSVWFNSVIRADVHQVRIGRGSNIQDGTIIHVNRKGFATIVGDYVTVGHAARLHGCTIGSNSLVGIGAIVLDGAHIEEECLVAAGSLVTPGMKVPKGSFVVGAPATVKRRLTAQDLDMIRRSAENYIKLSADYKAQRS